MSFAYVLWPVCSHLQKPEALKGSFKMNSSSVSPQPVNMAHKNVSLLTALYKINISEFFFFGFFSLLNGLALFAKKNSQRDGERERDRNRRVAEK